MSQLGDKTADADHSIIGYRAVDQPFAQLSKLTNPIPNRSIPAKIVHV
jgi:hypothetical protein